VPKVETIDDVDGVAAALDRLETQRGIARGEPTAGGLHPQ
jgi:hypothetical protein